MGVNILTRSICHAVQMQCFPAKLHVNLQLKNAEFVMASPDFTPTEKAFTGTYVRKIIYLEQTKDRKASSTRKSVLPHKSQLQHILFFISSSSEEGCPSAFSRVRPKHQL